MSHTLSIRLNPLFDSTRVGRGSHAGSLHDPTARASMKGGPLGVTASHK